MKHLFTRLTIALILVSCILIRPLTAHAQGDLDKSVPDMKFYNELLKNVLEELSRDGGVTFSYNSKILKKKQLVTLTMRASTLRQALADILGDGYSFVMMDNYVIIRKNGDDMLAIKAKRTTKATKALAKKAVKDPLNIEIKEAKMTMRSIIDDIVKENIVSDKEGVTWFALDGGQFIVNGQSMPDSLRTKFAARYIKPDGMGYYYGPVDVRGKGVFMDKEDLY